MIFIFLVLWIGYAIIEGYREAYYWFFWLNSSLPNVSSKINLHKTFAAQRAVVNIILSIGVYYITNSLFYASLISIASDLIFSFFHNGMMYLTRNNISKKYTPDNIIYKKRWFDQSGDSTALSTKLMSPISRTIQAIIGLIIYVIVFSLG